MAVSSQPPEGRVGFSAGSKHTCYLRRVSQWLVERAIITAGLQQCQLKGAVLKEHRTAFSFALAYYTKKQAPKSSKAIHSC